MKLFRGKKVEEELFAGIEDEPELPDAPTAEQGEPEGPADAADLPPAEEDGPGADAVEAEEQPSTGKDFFDLPSEKLADYQTPGVIVASNRTLELKPLLKVLAVAAVVGLLVTGIVFLWPSSDARVPTLVGKNLNEAMDLARAGGFDPLVKSWSYSERHPDGVVLSQEPNAMQVVQKGKTLTLVVSKGPRPEEGNRLETNTVAPQTEPAAASPFAGKSICVDPGGQKQPGQDEWSDPGMTRKEPPEDIIRGTLSGNAEYTVNLDIAKKLKSLLEKDGIKVVMTRDTDDVNIPNTTRVEMANNAAVDLYVRVHCGSSGEATRMGVETLYPAQTKWTEPFYQQSKEAALFVQAELLKTCGIEDLGAAAVHDLAGFNWSRVPVIQTDAGFLSSPRDDSLLAQDDFRWKVAWGLRNGIIKYLTNP
jgi:N-acetylmuramoyl-L-alanine amidase